MVAPQKGFKSTCNQSRRYQTNSAPGQLVIKHSRTKVAASKEEIKCPACDTLSLSYGGEHLGSHSWSSIILLVEEASFINTLFAYDFEEIQVDLITSWPQTCYSTQVGV